MKEEVLNTDNRYEEILISQCEYMGYCPEKHSCGKEINRKEFYKILKEGKEKLKGE